METPYYYQNGRLFCEDVDLAALAGREGTPCYVYSARAILDRYHAYDRAFGDLPHKVCYAVKANSNLGILKLVAGAGAGFDIVSGGELYRVLKAGGDPGAIVFSGVGKTEAEIEYALDSGIHSFNCESALELRMLDELAGRRGKKARAALRVNPDVNAVTHRYISTGLREHKFGIDISEVEELYRRPAPNLTLDGVSCHIGSQLLDVDPVMEAADKMLALAGRLRTAGFDIRYLDLGGGLGVPYRTTDRAPAIGEFIARMRERVAQSGLTIMIEPGRSIVGEAGILLTRVLNRKTNGAKQFVIVDAAMNDLLRPALYQAHHEIVPLLQDSAEKIVADVVGPVCESGDFFARDREIESVPAGALLGICSAGAYGFVQASNYNARPRPAEVLVEGAGWRTVRARESYEDLVRGE